jgi:hypothetical protein
MNEQQVIKAAAHIAQFAARAIDKDAPWANLDRKQALQDALQCLKLNEVIEDYDMAEGTVTVGGFEYKRGLGRRPITEWSPAGD